MRSLMQGLTEMAEPSLDLSLAPECVAITLKLCGQQRTKLVVEQDTALTHLAWVATSLCASTEALCREALEGTCMGPPCSRRALRARAAPSASRPALRNCAPKCGVTYSRTGAVRLATKSCSSRLDGAALSSCSMMSFGPLRIVMEREGS